MSGMTKRQMGMRVGGGRVSVVVEYVAKALSTILNFLIVAA